MTGKPKDRATFSEALGAVMPGAFGLGTGTALALSDTGRLIRPDWMRDPVTLRVMSALTAGGGTARFVGGCVRDALLRLHSADVDIAVDCVPDETRRKLEAAGIRCIPTGIAHGTVTAVADGATFEITTLRADVSTDGRWADVAFTGDWAGDAARRDFTINALYADTEGRLFDFTGGLADLAAGRVRFVGDPARRVAEDHLRILRFFRFHARFGSGPPEHAALSACVAAAARIADLSAERVRQEMLKLLTGPRPSETLILMAETGILRFVLPKAQDFARLATLVTVEGLTTGADGIRRLAALYPWPFAEVRGLAQRLRLSNAEAARLEAMCNAPARPDPEGSLAQRRRLLYHLGEAAYTDLALLGWANALSRSLPGAKTVSRWDTESWLAVVRLPGDWPRPKFPLSGYDLQALGLSAGPEMGAVLRAVEEWWIDDGFRADRAACLAEAARRLPGQAATG